MTTICIDPGHGGHARGGGSHDNLDEANWALNVARLIRGQCSELGVSAHMTRDSDKYMSLEERGRRAMQMGAELCLSLHINSAPEGYDPASYKGGLVFHAPGNRRGSMVAEEIARRLPGALQRARVFPGEAGDFPGVAEVMRCQPGTSVLAEFGYGSHEYDRTYLLSEWASAACANAVMGGILYWLEHYA